MRTQIANWFGVAADTLALVASAACAYAITRPYRLSPPEMALLEVADLVQLAGPALAICFAVISLGGNARARQMGFVALALAVPTLLFALLTSQPHSTSRW
jgi:hypothetical protein